jgi:preprotein translocase subunit SecY
MFDMFTGGALGRMTVFALNIMPYISASIIVQLMTAAIPTWEALKKEGETGRKKLNQYTRYLTVVHRHRFRPTASRSGSRACAGSFGPRCRSGLVLPHLLRHHAGRRHHVPDVARRADHRARRRQRHQLIIFAGIVANLPSALAGTLELGRTGALSTFFIIFFLLPRWRHRLHRLHRAGAAPHPGAVPEAPGRQPHVRRRGLASAAEAEHRRRDSADLRLLAAAAAGDHRGFSRRRSPEVADRRIAACWRMAAAVHGCSIIALIVFFAFFYTAVVFNPQETADNLKKYGGFVPGIRPGSHGRVSRPC